MPAPLGDIRFVWPYYAAAAIAYLIGAIPFGLILARLAGKGDIRRIGSGNIGATNVLRTGNKTLALLTLILDSGKGALCVAAGARLGPDMAAFAGAGAVLGHVFPIWLGFRGGKGVATALGTLLAAAWPVGALACATWLAVAALFRYSSLAGLAALGLAPLYAFLFAGPPIPILALFIASLVALRHGGNIRRLIGGREPKIGQGGDHSPKSAHRTGLQGD